MPRLSTVANEGGWRRMKQAGASASLSMLDTRYVFLLHLILPGTTLALTQVDDVKLGRISRTTRRVIELAEWRQ